MRGVDTIAYFSSFFCVLPAHIGWQSLIFPIFLVFWRHFAGSTDGFLVVETQTGGFSWTAKTSDDHTCIPSISLPTNI